MQASPDASVDEVEPRSDPASRTIARMTSSGRGLGLSLQSPPDVRVAYKEQLTQLGVGAQAAAAGAG